LKWSRRLARGEKVPHHNCDILAIADFASQSTRQAVVDLVGDDVSEPRRKPGREHAVARANLQAQAVTIERYISEELPGRLRVTQIVL